MSSFKFNISQEIWDTIFGKEEQTMSDEKLIKDAEDVMRWVEYSLYDIPTGHITAGLGLGQVLDPDIVPDKMMTNLSSVISQKEFLDYCYRNSWGNIYDNVV